MAESDRRLCGSQPLTDRQNYRQPRSATRNGYAATHGVAIAQAICVLYSYFLPEIGKASHLTWIALHSGEDLSDKFPGPPRRDGEGIGSEVYEVKEGYGFQVRNKVPLV